MGSVNRMIVIGHLGGDPELKQLESGKSVANFSVATTDRWTDQQGVRQERTEWHRVVVWGKGAELCAKYLTKGRLVYVEGRVQTRKWVDKEGRERVTTEVVAEDITFLDAGKSAGRTRGEEGANEAA